MQKSKIPHLFGVYFKNKAKNSPKLIIFHQSLQLSQFLAEKKASKKTIAFVPTMGSLHQGHISLITHAKAVADICVCSIFVNPKQFNDPKDLLKYPRTPEKDILLLNNSKCDILFMPSEQEIYHNEADLNYLLDGLDLIIEGEQRPGHFQGVANVVHRLFEIVKPNKAIFGLKDFQQCLVVKSMVNHLQLPVEIITLPTIREASGLAMSSRNERLSEATRTDAAYILKVLEFVKANVLDIPLNELLDEAKQKINQNAHFKLEYLLVVNSNTLLPVDKIDKLMPLVILTAVWADDVRLIDNLLIFD